MFAIPRFALHLLAALFVLLAVSVALAPAALAATGESTTPSVLADTSSWGLLAGVLSPLLISVVQRPGWSPRVRVVVSVAVSVIVGVLTLLANGSFNDGAQTILTTLALVVVVSSSTYRGIYKPLGVAQKIEVATSPGATSRSQGESE